MAAPNLTRNVASVPSLRRCRVIIPKKGLLEIKKVLEQGPNAKLASLDVSGLKARLAQLGRHKRWS